MVFSPDKIVSFTGLICLIMKRLLLPVLVVLMVIICYPATANTYWYPGLMGQPAMMFTDVGSLPHYLPEAIKAKAQDGVHLVSLEYSGKRKGIARVRDMSGDLVLEAGFKHHKLDGYWKADTEEGYFEHGLPHGEWIYYNDQGEVTAIRQYDAGKLVAVGRDIRYYNPKRTNSRIASMVKSQRMDLEDVLMGHNELAGLRPPFSMALHHGQFINYYPGGQVKDSCYYNEGFRDGMFISFHQNGRMQLHGYYLHGSKHGSWTSYSESGRLLEMTEFRHGKSVFTKDYTKLYVVR